MCISPFLLLNPAVFLNFINGKMSAPATNAFFSLLQGFDGENILLRDIVLKRALNLPSLQRS